MRTGTKSLLFGVHCLPVHAFFVLSAWWRLYGFPWDPRIWFAALLHDIGYWGLEKMDDAKGEEHVLAGARLMGYLFDDDETGYWYWFTVLHSRFWARKHGLQVSSLCVADKFSLAITPGWLYLLQANLSGEIHEYMEGKGGRTAGKSQWEWLAKVKAVCRKFVVEQMG